MTEEEMLPIIPDVSNVVANAMLDSMTSVGLGHVACELVHDNDEKDACRHLLEPLDKGTGDPIEELSKIQMAHPEEFDKVSDYLNDVIIRVTEMSNQNAKKQNAEG